MQTFCCRFQTVCAQTLQIPKRRCELDNWCCQLQHTIEYTRDKNNGHRTATYLTWHLLLEAESRNRNHIEKSTRIAVTAPVSQMAPRKQPTISLREVHFVVHYLCQARTPQRFDFSCLTLFRPASAYDFRFERRMNVKKSLRYIWKTNTR